MRPEIYVEMHLIFDNDFDVHKLTKVIDIQPFECMNKDQTRINPLTNEHNPGFWTTRSAVFAEFDSNHAIDNLLSKIECKVELIKKICVKNDGNVVFDIVPSFPYNNTPAIYFNRRFLEIVNYLEAEIQLDMYVFGEK